VSISLLLLGYVIYKLDWSKFFTYYRLTMKGYLLMCSFVLLSLLIDCLRFFFILKIFSIHITIYQVLTLNWLGLFFNNVLPGSVGGDIIKSYYLHKKGYKFVNLLFISFLDRACGLYGLSINFIIGLYILPRYNKKLFYFALILFTIFWLCTFLIVFTQFFKKFIANLTSKMPLVKNYHESLFIPFLEILNKPSQFLLPIFISILTHLSLFGAIYIGGTFWEQNIVHNFLNYFAIVPIGFIITALPISISGWGTGEVGFGFIYSTFGYPSELGVAISILYKFTLLILSTPGFIVWLYLFFFKKQL
jgi:glycosyltransferase 2 family protein